MRIFLVATLSMISANALASEAVDLSSTIQSCWRAPSGVEGQKLSATLSVEFGPGGSVKDISAITKPSDGTGRAFVSSVSRAIERCAPYPKLPEGKVKVIFKTPIGKAPIDPFK